MSAVDPERVRSALRGRLALAAETLGLEPGGEIEELVRALGSRAATGAAGVPWLVFTAFFGRFPTQPELARLRRELILQAEPLDAFLVTGATLDRRAPAGLRDMAIVSDRPLVDVAHAATTDHATGIQRVIRRTIPHWAGRPHELVAWLGDDRGYRRLDEAERARVGASAMGDESGASDGAAARAATDGDDRGLSTLRVPWRTTVILPEVPALERCAPLAALAADSGSRVAILGYDLIPLVSADLVDAGEAERTGRFLSVVKDAAVVAGISESAALEFRGYAAALAAQGIGGPRVLAVPLAEEGVPAGPSVAPGAHAGEPPLVLCVGSHEPRKNQAAVLAAASRLHREGVAFRLVFVGGGSRVRTGPFDLELERLRRDGLPVESHRMLDDAGLAALYAEARCTVMVSLHEGFGLPVVESLARGVPVLTSDHGSLAEVAAAGGCVTVDARDIAAVTDGLRSLLADGELVARLRVEAAARPVRTWAAYADELWDALAEVPR